MARITKRQQRIQTAQEAGTLFDLPSTRRFAFLAAVVLLKEPTKDNLKRFLTLNGSKECDVSFLRMEEYLFKNCGVVLERQTKYLPDPKNFRYFVKDWGVVCRYRLVRRYRDHISRLMPGEVKDEKEMICDLPSAEVPICANW